MPIFSHKRSTSNKHFSVHKFVAISTMVSPTHTTHLRPLVQAGGGDAISEIPSHQLILSNEIQEHLRDVYDELRKPEECLTKARFVAWLSSVQNLELQLSEETYKFEQFLETLHYSNGFQAVKQLDPEKKDMSKPISNYYISSSHNTYLSGNQLISKSTTDAYKNVLIRGCRCIEIDVHNGEAHEGQSNDNLSKSLSHSPKPDHKKHLSGSTLSSRAASLLEKADEKFDNARSKLSEALGKDAVEQQERGRSLTTNSSSLEVEKSIDRPASVRSMRSGEPLVLHGWTFTAPVGFRAVCKSIRETAFQSSNLPIIVSLEVHADLDQQQLMVEIMKEEWEGLLIDTAHPTCNPEDRLPRLDELLNKILIKVKKATNDKLDSTPTPNSAATLAPIIPKTDADSNASEDEKASSKKKTKICDALSNLGIYTHSEHFSSFTHESATKPSHVFSIGENDIIEIHKNKKRRAEMFAHNRDFFMRAYPAGFRIDSSNLDPSVFWRKGVQMVALNWQELDEGMMLNEGMFAGEQGWVLKPPGFRSDASEAMQYKTLDLKITVYGGQHIPLPEGQSESGIHPYIKCELHVENQKLDNGNGENIDGGKQKEGEYKAKSRTVKTDHPDFGKDGDVLAFPRIDGLVEELSFVRFKVEDARYMQDELAAWACIRLDRLQQGFRFVNLLDEKGTATPGLLMIKVEKKLQML